MYDLQQNSKDLIQQLNWVSGFKRGYDVPAKESAAGFIKIYGDVIAEIDLCIREICNAPMYEETFTLEQTAEQLHLSNKKTVELIRSGKLDARKARELSGKVSDHYIIGSRAIAKYFRQDKREQKKQEQELSNILLDKINAHRNEMEFDFDGSQWIASGTLWAKASSLYSDLKKYGADRLKICKECSSLFWDSSINKAGLFCKEQFCRDKRNLIAVAKSRNKKNLKSKKQKTKRGK